MKRVLIIAADSLLTDFYTQCLTTLGFQTQSANTIDSGIVTAWELQPDLVLLDPIFPEPIDNPAQRIRAGGRLTTTPFLAMSPLPAQLSAPLMRTGVKVAAVNPGQSVAQILQAINEMLGGVDANQIVGLVHQRRWRALLMQKASQSIASLRIAAHGLVKSGHSPAIMHTLFFESHFLSQCTEIAELFSLHKFTAALEQLVFQIKEQPSHLNPSILRTLTQAIDFMDLLFLPNNLDRITDPSDSQLFAVDDDQNLLNLLYEAMENVGLHTSCISDPLVALEMVKAGLFNLIFLDVGMPEMNGFELCKKIRAIPAYAHVPIVFITGMSSFTNQVQSKIHGGSDFIAKPFDIQELRVKALMWIFKEQLELV